MSLPRINLVPTGDANCRTTGFSVRYFFSVIGRQEPEGKAKTGIIHPGLWCNDTNAQSELHGEVFTFYHK